MRKPCAPWDALVNRIPQQSPPKLSAPETFLSLARFQRAWPPRRVAVVSRPAIPPDSSRGSLYQLAYAPEVSLNSSRHCWSAAQRVVALHEVVIGEVQPDRCLKVLQFLAECQSEASQAAHVQPGGRV